MVEQLGQQVARAKEPGTDAGLSHAKYRGDLHAGELFECRQHHHFAFAGRKPFNTGENVSVMLRGGSTCFRA